MQTIHKLEVCMNRINRQQGQSQVPAGAASKTAETKWGKIQILSTIPIVNWIVSCMIWSRPKTAQAPSADLTAKYLNSYSNTDAAILAFPIVGSIFAIYKVIHQPTPPAPLKELTFADLSRDQPIDITKFQTINGSTLGHLLNTSEDQNYYTNVSITDNISSIINQQANKEEFIRDFIISIKSSADLSPERSISLIKWMSENFVSEAVSKDKLDELILASGWTHVASLSVDARWKYATKDQDLVSYALNRLTSPPYQDPRMSALTFGFDTKCKHTLETSNIQNMDQVFIDKLEEAIKLKGESFFSTFFFNKGTQLANAFIASSTGQIDNQFLRTKGFTDIEFAYTILKNCRLDDAKKLEVFNKIGSTFNLFPHRNPPTGNEFRIILNVLKEFNKFNSASFDASVSPLLTRNIGKLFIAANRFVQGVDFSTLNGDDKKSMRILRNIFKKLEQTPNLFTDEDKQEIRRFWNERQALAEAPPPSDVQIPAPKGFKQKLQMSFAQQKTKAEQFIQKIQQTPLSIFLKNQDVFITDYQAFSNWIENEHIDFRNRELNTAMKNMIMALPTDMRKEYIRHVAHVVWIHTRPADRAALIGFFKNIYDETNVGPSRSPETFYTWVNIEQEPPKTPQESAARFTERRRGEDANFWKTLVKLCFNPGTREFNAGVESVFPHHTNQEDEAFCAAVMANMGQQHAPLRPEEWNTWSPYDQNTVLRLLESKPDLKTSPILFSPELQVLFRTSVVTPALITDIMSISNTVDEVAQEISEMLTTETSKSTDFSESLCSLIFNEEIARGKLNSSNPDDIAWLALYKKFGALKERRGDMTVDEYQNEYKKQVAELIISASILDDKFDKVYDHTFKCLNAKWILDRETIEAMRNVKSALKGFLDEVEAYPNQQAVLPLKQKITGFQQKFLEFEQRNESAIELIRRFGLLKDQNELESNVANFLESFNYSDKTLPKEVKIAFIASKMLYDIKRSSEILDDIEDVQNSKEESGVLIKQRQLSSFFSENRQKLKREQDALKTRKESLEAKKQQELRKEPEVIGELRMHNPELEKIETELAEVDANLAGIPYKLEKTNSLLWLSARRCALYEQLFASTPQQRREIAQQLLYLANKEKSGELFSNADRSKILPLPQQPSREQQQAISNNISQAVGKEYEDYMEQWNRLFVGEAE